MPHTDRFIELDRREGSVFLRMGRLEMFSGRDDDVGRYLLVRLRRPSDLSAPYDAGLTGPGRA